MEDVILARLVQHFLLSSRIYTTLVSVLTLRQESFLVFG